MIEKDNVTDVFDDKLMCLFHLKDRKKNVWKKCGHKSRNKLRLKAHWNKHKKYFINGIECLNGEFICRKCKNTFSNAGQQWRDHLKSKCWKK